MRKTIILTTVGHKWKLFSPRRCIIDIAVVFLDTYKFAMNDEEINILLISLRKV
jgi:hypothetical protein